MIKYNSIIFDCDGVILNSNAIKTEAFRNILNNYDLNAVDEFIDYHRKNGGISRYAKLEHFLKNILPKYSKGLNLNKDHLKILLKNYSKACRLSLCSAQITEGLFNLREISRDINWLIISGGDQKELRYVFNKLNIDKYFNGGIYGSPDKKMDIVKKEISNGLIKFPALMLGDSKLDHLVAKENNIDFLFVYQWTDFEEYEAYCKNNSIRAIKSVEEMGKILN